MTKSSNEFRQLRGRFPARCFRSKVFLGFFGLIMPDAVAHADTPTGVYSMSAFVRALEQGGSGMLNFDVTKVPHTSGNTFHLRRHERKFFSIDFRQGLSAQGIAVAVMLPSGRVHRIAGACRFVDNMHEPFGETAHSWEFLHRGGGLAVTFHRGGRISARRTDANADCKPMQSVEERREIDELLRYKGTLTQ